MSKGHALAAVRTIAEHLPVAVEDPSDLRAREATAGASLQAGLAFTNALLGATHAIVRRGLRSILELEQDIAVVGEAGGPAEALRTVERTRPRAVARGESGFDSRSAAVVRALAAGRPAAGAGDAIPALTEREREVVRLIAEGLTNREIGQAIFVNESTVKFHVRNIMGKLDVHHRAEVAYVASRLGLLEHA